MCYIAVIIRIGPFIDCGTDKDELMWKNRRLTNEELITLHFITKPTHINTHNVYGTFIPKNFTVTGFQPVKKFPAFYGTQSFITAFTSARHISLS